ncbi:quaternary ammonium compound efflux SMR transporter SugE [Planctomicrobium piriforme]|uniref:Guanidinium exporter n=1 Tax=Planctomicrobium piriforme TaxID=1576369 RepID=A0A1I3QEH3_9PLAN|nr:quaternary ammonium compound efflux SMR transporter SugE [Planctomicrobium piriforme]SFJ32318.1 quaternary ammonium compound-resistance protein SugE [Planctomicrobium piriforme]
MSWFLLIVAGLFEVAWASSLKSTQGFTRLGPTLFFLTTLTLSMVLLAIALRTIPTGTGYAVWTGIGAVGTVIVGICFFHEPATPVRLGCLALILLGIIGLKLGSH